MSFEFPNPSYLLPFLLYAETHYRFKYFFSYLRKKEPEVIADAPHRVEPGKPIPLLILAKDAQRYPCRLSQIHVTVRQGDVVLLEKKLLKSPQRLSKRLWWHVYYLTVRRPARLGGPHKAGGEDFPSDRLRPKGWISIDVELTLEQNGKKKIYHNDNHRTSSHRPLEVFLASDPLPSFKGLYFGDAHTHSDYTDDQVEFGSPLKASVELCKSMGLSFFCVTDHSYDLDDTVDDYLTNDPALPKWRNLQREASKINSGESRFKIVVGEEVSCLNSSGNNVHLLVLGSGQYFAGSGDSAERWFRTRGEHTLEEIAGHTKAVTFAAHPKESVSFLERLLLGRGNWGTRDLIAEGLTGVQIVNGDFGDGFRSGYESWIAALLRGERSVLLGGNDAHGNFNRFRQIGIPFFLIRENGTHIFGKMRTGVFIEGGLGQSSILDALRNGRSIVTDGPVARMRVRGGRSRGEIGSKLTGKEFVVEIEALSSAEFGALTEVTCFLGEIGRRKERRLEIVRQDAGFEFHTSFGFRISHASYMRLEVRSSSNSPRERSTHFCVTNPVWINAWISA